MKTIIWKEIREHARWVPLGIIAIVIVLVLQWRSSILIFDRGQTLIGLVGLIASGIAICLGALQSWSDHRPAARALLLHRGITANTVFWGKLLSGFLLYAVAVIMPLLAMAVFIVAVGIDHLAATPMALLPAGLISIAAFGFWPASMLAVQRDAWFVGSRLFPGLVVGMTILICGVFMTDILQELAIVMALVMLVVLVAIARSVFVNNSQVATGGGRAGLTVVVTTVLLTAIFTVGSMLESYRLTIEGSSGRRVSHFYAVELGPAGRAWLTRRHNSPTTYRLETDRIAKMEPGRSVRDQLQSQDADWKPIPKIVTTDVSRYYDHTHAFGGRFIQIASNSIPSDEGFVQRFWVYDFVEDKMLVYKLDGFRKYRLESIIPPNASVGSFGRYLGTGHYDQAGNFSFVTSTGVYQVPGVGSEIELIYSWPKTSELVSLKVVSTTSVSAGNSRFSAASASGCVVDIALRFEDRIVLLNSTSAKNEAIREQTLGAFSGLDEVFLTEVHLPNYVGEKDSIRIARDPIHAGTYLGVVNGYVLDTGQVSWVRFDQDGQIKEQEQYADILTPDSNHLNGIELGLLIPPAVTGLGTGVASIAMAVESGGVRQAWEQAPSSTIETLTIVILLGGVQSVIGIPLAIWAARRRKLDRRTTRRWLWWAFFFGPCGSLAILAVYPRIATETC
jgi:hypothetical protein